MFNESTNGKSQEDRYLVGTQVVYSQENSTGNHNSILPTIYISVYNLCYDYISSYSNIHVLFSWPLLIFHISISRLACYAYVP